MKRFQKIRDKHAPEFIDYCAETVDWSRFSLEQFRFGMDVEFEHGSHDPQTDVTGDDPIVTGKIALAHMKEFPDYYERLERMEAEAERDWAAKKSDGS